MRDIKFRAKGFTDKKWRYGFYFQTKVDGEIKHWIHDPVSDLPPDRVDPTTIGQYWKKGGKEFYGGDLFYAEASPSGSNRKRKMLCKVVDGQDGMSVVVKHEGEWWHYGSMDFTSIKKIIGSIHDKELKDV